jgi:glyoxylate carboligase
MKALRTRQDKIKFIQVRHEESAAFMATANAKWTQKLGVCLDNSGPGGTHLVTGRRRSHYMQGLRVLSWRFFCPAPLCSSSLKTSPISISFGPST